MNYKDTNSMNKMLVLLVVLGLVTGCAEISKEEAAIDAIELDMEVRRFDQLFAKSTINELDNLKGEFPYLFSKKYPDEYWAQRFKDTIQIEINEELAKAYSD
ncbi:MAG: gliding motility lipoprotein GldB, partial [Dokdonia donghaensis]|nr:gliding motility lipoprotein GldB [Dokdonia donghaensis]